MLSHSHAFRPRTGLGREGKPSNVCLC